MNINDRLSLFRDMIQCCHNLYFWTFDEDLHLIYSNCTQNSHLSILFTEYHRRQDFLDYAAARSRPIILTNELGLMWVAAPEKTDGILQQIHVLGPFFVDDASIQDIELNVQRLNFSGPFHREAAAFLRSLPVISLSRIFEYAVMLYFCISGERTTISELHYLENEPSPEHTPEAPELATQHGTYEAEQEMLRMVREGNLNYKGHMNKISMTGNMGKLSNGEPARQMKNVVLVCITLFSRAAIEGGLAPEISYTLTDHYFQSVEACGSMAELMEISHTMQEDFIQRVHRCQQNTSLSKSIHTCREYIRLHLEDELSLASLAQMLGYSEYYLSKKFKKETGQTLKEYIRRERIERAKYLLKTTQLGVQDIGDRLRFCSQSYFADTFRKVEGISPSEYRMKAVT